MSGYSADLKPHILPYSPRGLKELGAINTPTLQIDEETEASRGRRGSPGPQGASRKIGARPQAPTLSGLTAHCGCLRGDHPLQQRPPGGLAPLGGFSPQSSISGDSQLTTSVPLLEAAVSLSPV